MSRRSAYEVRKIALSNVAPLPTPERIFHQSVHWTNSENAKGIFHFTWSVKMAVPGFAGLLQLYHSMVPLMGTTLYSLRQSGADNDIKKIPARFPCFCRVEENCTNNYMGALVLVPIVSRSIIRVIPRFACGLIFVMTGYLN